MNEEFAVILRRFDDKGRVAVDNHAGIANLTALFAVERRLIEDDAQLRVARRRALDKLIAVQNRDDLRVGRLDRLVTQKCGRIVRLLDPFKRIALEEQILFRRTGKLPMAFHLFAKAFPVETELAFAGDRFEKLRRESERLIHFKRFGTENRHAPFGLHRLEDGVDAAQTVVDAAHEVFFFGGDHALNAFDRLAKLRIRDFHQVRDDRHQRAQERFAHPHLNAVENRATEQTTNDVFFLFRTGIDVFVNREGAGANMVGDATQTTTVFIRQVDGVVFLRADFRGGLDERTERIDVEVRLDALQHGRHAFKSHTRVDILARERTKVVGRIADAIELRED